MRTEDELAAALREGAAGAPAPDLLAGVEGRRRRRRRRRAQALAAVAVVAVVGTGTAVTRGIAVTPGDRPDRAVTAVTTAPEVAVPGQVRRPEKARAAELWPEAVFTMPARNPDGWRYRPITAVSPTEVLLSAESSFEMAGKLEVYDTRTREARVVAEVPKRQGLREYIPQTATVDGANVAWYAHGEQTDGTRVRDIWTVPLAGGAARLLVTRSGPDADLDGIALDGDHVVWSEVDGGVWRLPLAGGTPERLPGGDGLHLIHWPWASDVGEGPDSSQRSQIKVANLADGTVTAVPTVRGVKAVRCGPVWCFGHGESGTVVFRLDGTRTPRAVGSSLEGGLRSYPIMDRFVSAGDSVYDLKTGKLVGIDNPGSWYGAGTSSEPSTILYWGAGEGDSGNKPSRFRVLNLAAVPHAQ